MRNADRIAHSYALSGALTPNPFQRAAQAQLARHESARIAWPHASRHLELVQKLSEVKERAAGFHRRRQLEDLLGDYISDVQRTHRPHDMSLAKVPTRLHSCRRSGCWGWRPTEGTVVTAWDEKCGLVRLCPDEAREETARLANRYVPALLDQVRRGRRIYYAVLTIPNVAAGDLEREKRKLFKRFVALQRKQKGKRAALPIRGALVTLEDPLSSGGEWNIHLNVILVTSTWLDFAKLRDAWHWDVYIKPIRGTQAVLESTFRELVKYAGAPVSSKSHAKSTQEPADVQGGAPGAVTDAGAGWDAQGVYRLSDRRPVAPPMLAWPAERWLEWWDSQQRFRRTRSYGVLYNTPQPDPVSLSDVEWLGTVRWGWDGYKTTAPLNLIPAHKSTTELPRGRGPPRPYVPEPYLSEEARAFIAAMDTPADTKQSQQPRRHKPTPAALTREYSDGEIAAWLADYNQE